MPTDGRVIPQASVAPELAGYIGAADAARILGISRDHLRELRRRGRVRCLVTPIGAIYPREAIEALAYRRSIGEWPGRGRPRKQAQP
jgi:hypothetical protein